MVPLEFRNKYNVRDIPRCCQNCAFGEHIANFVVECTNPEINIGESIHTRVTQVCDAWAGKHPGREREC